jgi:hypothetical protein
MMIKPQNIIIWLVLAIILPSCPFYGYKYNSGFLPTYPVDLEDFNTQYDDFNLSAPTIDELIPLFFSSNRNSQGNDYDILLEYMEIEFDKNEGDLYAGKQVNDWYDRYDKTLLNDLLVLINTPANEFGPEVTLIENRWRMADRTRSRRQLNLQTVS